MILCSFCPNVCALRVSPKCQCSKKFHLVFVCYSLRPKIVVPVAFLQKTPREKSDRTRSPSSCSRSPTETRAAPPLPRDAGDAAQCVETPLHRSTRAAPPRRSTAPLTPLHRSTTPPRRSTTPPRRSTAPPLHSRRSIRAAPPRRSAATPETPETPRSSTTQLHRSPSLPIDLFPKILKYSPFPIPARRFGALQQLKSSPARRFGASSGANSHLVVNSPPLLLLLPARTRQRSNSPELPSSAIRRRPSPWAASRRCPCSSSTASPNGSRHPSPRPRAPPHRRGSSRPPHLPRLAGSMVQLQKIFLLGLKCTQEVGYQSTAAKHKQILTEASTSKHRLNSDFCKYRLY